MSCASSETPEYPIYNSCISAQDRPRIVIWGPDGSIRAAARFGLAAFGSAWPTSLDARLTFRDQGEEDGFGKEGEGTVASFPWEG